MSREKLAQLEGEGKYLFHGSGQRLESLEPKQAHTIIDGKKTPDGEPAIFASPFIDYAIFMALINAINHPKGFRSGVSTQSDRLIFRATKQTLDQLNDDTKGYVHILNKDTFEQRHRGEWFSHHPTTPEDIVEVTRKDFTPEIIIIPEEDQ